MNAASKHSYLEAMIYDEMAIAKLLGWKNLTRPSQVIPNFWIHGDKCREGTLASRTAIANMIPHWRRSWSGAGELIGRCNLSIRAGDQGVVVSTDEGHIFAAIYLEHPDKDSAIRFAMCRVAISTLTAEQV